ncbi:Hypothetical protein SCF082_LOCUS29421, partial [Durusdinium trenchii]
MVGLLVATIDCLGSDDESVREQYDRMTAHELFIRFKLSKRLVDDFIRPTLLVGLFKPPEELSALVVMELLYYYALAHQDSFDVRWIKNGTVADSLILPLSQMLEKDYGLTVLGGCRVGEISLEKSYNDKLSVQTLKYTKDGKEYEIGNIDGVVLALGCKGMQSVVNASPDLARLPVFSKVLATFPLFERIPLVDRASMVGLLVATIDCLGSDDESVREQYDRMTAHELFIRFKLSKRLVDDFIRPTLLVGLFKPPEELSALVVMELLYYYALAHQDSFDVRWIKNGTVADSLILPLSQMLEKDYGLTVLGGCRVGEISLEKSYNDKLSVQTLKYTKDGKEYEIGNIDGVVLALGCKGMQSVVNASPDLARLPVFSK